jgi:hypothetical protein
MKAEFYTLNDAEKQSWLDQHVPHRICAALAGLPMPEKWAAPRPNLPNRNFSVWCADRSIDEGRKAAMRWLIEFVGVRDKNGKPAAPRPHDNGKSVTIQQVGGRLFDTNSQCAPKLAKIWKACAQASLHPTTDTNHHPLREDDLAATLEIVIAHLETSLYKPSGRNLCEIVHEQEALRSPERSASEIRSTPCLLLVSGN